MVDLLKRNLLDKNFLLARGQLLHHRCAAHVINLIVKDGLKLVEPIVENIRESVKYIRSSQSRK
uniref:hAT-like transposase RNase-H fold domain-containing protein n=1 Tax=Arundo donax TaxID=35708 RepID=A0A0A9DMG4_ARUDO